MHLIDRRTADDVWCEAARLIVNREGTRVQESRAGETIELLHTCLVVRESRERWVVNRNPAMNPAFALAEVVWIVSGRDDAGFLNFWNPGLPRYAGEGPVYYGAYGHRLRYRFGVNQLRSAFETLDEVPDSRQVILQIWDAKSDLPVNAGKPRSDDVPCNLCSILKVRDERLEWVQVMRSNDLKLGWPHNVVQFTSLQEMMAAWLGIQAGSYTHFSDSLHVYAKDLENLVHSPSLDPEVNTDQWALSYDETMETILDIGHRMDLIRENARDPKVIERQGTHQYSAQAATNMLSLIAADAARRAGTKTLAADLGDRCTNPVLGQLWKRWWERKDAGSNPDPDS